MNILKVMNILQCIDQSRSGQEIERDLGIDPEAAGSHFTRIFLKLAMNKLAGVSQSPKSARSIPHRGDGLLPRNPTTYKTGISPARMRML
jgi:hypothetical protein